jgi:hypothetical protein
MKDGTAKQARAPMAQQQDSSRSRTASMPHESVTERSNLLYIHMITAVKGSIIPSHNASKHEPLNAHRTEKHRTEQLQLSSTVYEDKAPMLGCLPAKWQPCLQVSLRSSKMHICKHLIDGAILMSIDARDYSKRSAEAIHDLHPYSNIKQVSHHEQPWIADVVQQRWCIDNSMHLQQIHEEKVVLSEYFCAQHDCF